MDNSIPNQEIVPNEENLIPPELIKQEVDPIENIEIMEIDEMSSKIEEPDANLTDPIFDNLRNLKICHECGMQTDCIYQKTKSGKVVFYCTDKCMILNSLKNTPRPSNPANAQSSMQMQPPPLPSPSTPMRINDAASLYVRVCSTCSAIIQVNDYSNISWQARDFCSETCLTKHQVRFNSFCVECKCSIVDANNFGKFSMKFGNHVRTFCSKTCLDKYKIALVMCQFCNNDIMNEAQHKYLAPVTEYSSTFKQFCSINCVKNYCQYKLKLPYQNETDNVATCIICNMLKLVEIKFQHSETMTYSFCSEACFVKFQFYNKKDVIQCCICNILYEKVFFQRYCLYDNGVKNFCSQNCQTTYYIIARYIVECNNCKVKKYNFDMIQKTFPNKQTIHTCSFQCLKSSYRNMSRPIVSSCSQNEIKRLYGNLKNLMTLTIARNGALANKKNVATSCHPIRKHTHSITDSCKTIDSQTQTTSKNTVIPTPVPIYVPTPVPMYNIPVPVCVPIPVPIPIPIFIPTGCKSQQEITSKINKIWKEMPQDPLQADLIALAKTLNTSKTDTQKKNSHTKLKHKTKFKKSLKGKIINKTRNFGFNVLKKWICTTNKQKDLNQNLTKTNILYMTREELHICLIAFLKAINKAYSSATMYRIFLDIQKYLLENNKQEYIFLDLSFKKFIEHFNEITFDFCKIHKINSKLTEDYLWATNQLGTHTPYTLLNSLIYFNYKFFGLKTVQEHLNLLSMQVTYSKKPILNLPDSKLKYMYRLKFFPKINNEFGQKFPEIDKRFYNQRRCPGQLYEFYIQKCPTATNNTITNNNSNCNNSEINNKSFYLKPELACEPDSPIWFSNQVLDEWTIEMMLNRIKMIKEINEI